MKETDPGYQAYCNKFESTYCKNFSYIQGGHRHCHWRTRCQRGYAPCLVIEKKVFGVRLQCGCPKHPCHIDLSEVVMEDL